MDSLSSYVSYIVSKIQNIINNDYFKAQYYQRSNNVCSTHTPSKHRKELIRGEHYLEKLTIEVTQVVLVLH